MSTTKREEPSTEDPTYTSAAQLYESAVKDEALIAPTGKQQLPAHAGMIRSEQLKGNWLHDPLRAEIQEAVDRAAAKLGFGPSGQVQAVPAGRPGDLCTAAALTLARQAKSDPIKLAKELLETMELPSQVQRAELAGPYLNFHLDPSSVAEMACREPSAGSAGKRMVIEHTSVNPNKELHVGHLRNVVLGDSLARLMQAAGWEVEVHNYIDDTGRQAAEAILASQLYGQRSGQKADHAIGEAYVRFHGEPDKDSFGAQVTAVIHQLEAGEHRSTLEAVVEAQMATCRALGAQHDVLAWESDIIGQGLLEGALEALRPWCQQPSEENDPYAGCLTLQLPGSEPVVLLRSDGSATYQAKDIAYQLWKAGAGGELRLKRWRGGRSELTSAADGAATSLPPAEVINLIDDRQAQAQATVQGAARLLGGEGKHLGYAMVTLDGKAISGRRGHAISADSVIEEAVKRAAAMSPDGNAEDARRIGIGALRFSMLKPDPKNMIDFDLERALSLSGDTAPYIQYAAVRAASILRKAQEAGTPMGSAPADWSSLNRHDLQLARTMLEMGGAAGEAISRRSPHPVAQGLLSLASSLNGWYRAREDDQPATRVLGAPAGVREARLRLLSSCLHILESNLAMLGIEVPGAM